MSMGRRAFAGKTQANIVAAILASQPQPILILAANDAGRLWTSFQFDSCGQPRT